MGLALTHSIFNVTDALRRRYIDLHTRHQFQYVEEDRIKTKMDNIYDFAVSLKMELKCKHGTAEDDEKLSQLEITMDRLVGCKERVMFVSGVAGIGKSILAKQIVCHWANHELYDQFDLCLFIQCRELNYFHQENPAEINKSDIVDQFVKKMLDCNVLDMGMRPLIVIDGVDELFDIDEENSVIFQFLDKQHELYRKSSIIVTGRPHIQSIFEASSRDIGDYRVVEIKGLSDNGIQEYISKFSKRSTFLSKTEEVIGEMITSSGGYSDILHVPQFLSSVCCVFVLNGKKKLEHVTELYTWILYLLLKQHTCEKDKTSHKHFIPDVFKSCKEIILLLSKVSFHLLEKNEIIFEKCEFDVVFEKIDEKASRAQRDFLNGMFEEVSNEFGEKLQYKHLTLMEFMAAVHVFSELRPVDFLEQFLNRKSCDVVKYACGISGRLLAGEGIVKTMAKHVTGNCELQSAKSFLLDIMDSICHHSQINEHVRMSKLLDLVGCLPKKFKDKSFLKKLFSKLSCLSFSPTQEHQANMVEICAFLKSSGCSKKEVGVVFKDVGIKFLNVKSVEVLKIMRHFCYVDWLYVRDIILKKNDVKSIRKNLSRCNTVDIVNCNFEEEKESRELHDEIAKKRDTRKLKMVKPSRKTKVGFLLLCVRTC